MTWPKLKPWNGAANVTLDKRLLANVAGENKLLNCYQAVTHGIKVNRSAQWI